MALDRPTVGRRIAEARNAHGWSARELGEKIGSSQRSVQRWEAGVLPRTGTLLELSRLLDVPSYFLVDMPEFDEIKVRLDRIDAKLDALTRKNGKR